MPIPSSPGRRDLFSRGFPSLVSNIADLLDLKEPLAFLGLDRSYVKLCREAMASNFEVIFCAHEKTVLRRVAMEILDEFDRLESILSIWKGDSELARVNAQASKAPVPVSPAIFAWVSLAKKIFSETEGAYDISCTPLARCWGFFFRHGRMPQEQEIAEARSRVGMQHVILDEERQTIFFEKEGMELTPASIGKGYALDRGAAIAREKGLGNVLLNGGFSSVYAAGAPAWKDRWQFNLRHPNRTGENLALISLRDRGFSSSGRVAQKFVHEGKVYGHIIDPRFGHPAEHIETVSVFAPTAAEA